MKNIVSLLDEREVEAIRVFADHNMKMQPTANAMHYHVRTMYKVFASIYNKTGQNPFTFWGLAHLIEEIQPKEVKDGREN